MTAEVMQAPERQSTGEDVLLSTTEAARLAGLTTKTIRNWIQQRRLRPYRAGRVLRLKRVDVVALLSGDLSAEASADDVARDVMARLRAA